MPDSNPDRHAHDGKRIRLACWTAAACACALVVAQTALAGSTADHAADRLSAQINSILPLVTGGIAAVALLFVALWIMSARKRAQKANTLEDTPLGTSKTASRDVSYPEQVSPVSKEETEDMDADNTRPYVANGHDYTEDVSRYTQQPGPEVNDVSRFTHGVGLDDEDDFQSLQNRRSTPPASRPSVGSRVERRRSAKKRKRR